MSRWVPFVSLLCLAGSLFLGCSHQDFGRPIAGTLSDVVDSGKPYVSTDQEAAAAARAQRFAKVLAAWEAEEGKKASGYDIGSDDVLEIAVLSLESPGRITTLDRTVSKEGQVTLPLLGAIKAKGLNTDGLERQIKAGYAGRYIKNPDVTVRIKEYRSATVVLTGAVAGPGVYYLRRNRSTILEVLAEANGLKTEAGDTVLIIRGGSPGSGTAAAAGAAKGKLITVDLKQLVDDGDLRVNLWVRAGDIVTVPPRERTYVYVLGYVQHPGGFEMPGGKPLEALRAVAMAGGLTGSARAQNSFLIRETPRGQKIVPVDLTKIARGQRPPLFMAGGDTLVVGSGLFARLAEFIKPSVSAGMSYSPAPVP